MLRHEFFCPIATGDMDICTCGALFRAALRGDLGRAHAGERADIDASTPPAGSRRPFRTIGWAAAASRA